MSKCTYLINMDDGRLEFRDEFTETQANMQPIPDDVKDMILRGEVTSKDVISAISVKIKESGEFNIAEYIEKMKKLNVRQSNKQEAPVHEPLADVPDAVSVSEVKAAQDAAKEAQDTASVKTARRDRVKKVNAALESEKPAQKPVVIPDIEI